MKNNYYFVDGSALLADVRAAQKELGLDAAAKFRFLGAHPKPAKEVTTDSGPGENPPPAHRLPQASAAEPYRGLIETSLGRGRNAMAIWQDLVSEHGFAGSYQSVCVANSE